MLLVSFTAISCGLLIGSNAFHSDRLITRFSPLPLQLATSSRDLKDRGERRRGKRTAADIDVSLKLLSRARTLRDTRNVPKTLLGEETVGDLTQLTEVIDARLRGSSPSSNFADGRINLSSDSMGALLGYNNIDKTKSGHEIVVLFGKQLIDDQVTVEYASRIRTLALLLKNNEIDPDLICFCGEIRDGNHISDADAGFLFFKHLCANEGICVKNINVFLDRTSSNEVKALQHVSSHIRKEHITEWLASSQEAESSKDEYGYERALPRKKIILHFTLISNEYHLCNLNDVHHRSPNQSPLRPIEMLRTTDRSHQEIRTEYDDELSVFESSTKDKKPVPPIHGIIDCSWSYMYSTYPYSYTTDDASAFMGRCYLLGEELIPLFINMKGVVAEREFLQRDNYVTAAAIRHKLVSLMEDLYRTSPGLRSGLREVTSFSAKKETVDIVLEGATLSLGRCIDLLRPAGLHQASVSKAEYTKALRWLNHCITQIQTLCDPDRPLDQSEWGRMTPPQTEELPTTGEDLMTKL